MERDWSRQDESTASRTSHRYSRSVTLAPPEPITPLVFVDLETDGLMTPWLPTGRRVWEASVIRRDVDGSESSCTWFVRLSDLQFNPEALTAHQKIALEVGGFFQRHPQLGGESNHDADIRLVTERQLAEQLMTWCAGTPTMVGATPSFDASSIEELFRRKSLLDAFSTPPWRLRLVCVWSLVAGKLGVPPASLTRDAVAVELGLRGAYAAHSAYDDCRWARDVYDRITSSNSDYVHQETRPKSHAEAAS